MIVNKNALMVVHTSRADKNVPVLDNVHIEPDGTCIGSSGKTVLMVSPVNEQVKEKLTETKILRDSKSRPMTIPAETIRTIIKDLPADKKFGGLLEHCNIKGDGDECRVELTDGKRKRSFEGKLYPKDYIPYEKLIGPALKRTEEEEDGMRVVLNKKRLLHLLDCINKIAPDSSDDDPIYVSFTERGDIVLRGENYKTGQRFIACMWAYTGGEGEWLELNEWEEKYAKMDPEKVGQDRGNTSRGSGMGNKKNSKKRKKFKLKKRTKKETR